MVTNQQTRTKFTFIIIIIIISIYNMANIP